MTETTKDLAQDLADVLALAERATPGDWRWSDNGNIVPTLYTADCEVAAVYTDDDATGAPNAPAIIAAMNFLRTHGPALAALVEDAWQPIETAPERQRVLVCGGATPNGVCFAECDPGRYVPYDPSADRAILPKAWYSDTTRGSGSIWPSPTHWMPVPAAHEQGDKATPTAALVEATVPVSILQEMATRWLDVSKDFDRRGFISWAGTLYDASRELDAVIDAARAESAK